LVAKERHLHRVGDSCLVLHLVLLPSTGSSSRKVSLRVKRLSAKLAAAYAGTVAYESSA
jgi:hypothetical protein